MRGFGARSLAMLGWCAVSGCGGDAARSPLPQVADRGGPVMAHPALVPVMFADDPDAAALTAFTQWIATSSWLAAVGADYGVGAGSVLGVVHRPEAAPAVIRDDEIIDLVFRGLADGSIPRPVDGDLGEVLYMVHFPPATVVTAGRATSCVGFGGYHASARRGGVELAYAVLPTCPGLVAEHSALEIRELVSSHELIEAATDPFPANHPGFALDDPISPWLALGSEVSDLCVRGDRAATWSEAGFVAQRSWSNAAAAAGEDPCVPGQRAPYFTVAPALAGVPRIAPGKQRAIDLHGYAPDADDDFAWRIDSATGDDVALTLGRDTLTSQQSATLVVGIADDAVDGAVLRFSVYSSAASGYDLMPMFAVVGSPCASYTSCEDCAARTGCGWCGTTGRCESEGASGSLDSACPASGFATWAGSCPGLCAAHGASCTACSSQDGCGWCGGAAPRCLEADHATGQSLDASCDYADWSFTPSYCP